MKWTRDPFKQMRNTVEHLRLQEDSVLLHWAARKKSLDVCLQYVIFEKSAKKVRPLLVVHLHCTLVNVVRTVRSVYKTISSST